MLYLIHFSKAREVIKRWRRVQAENAESAIYKLLRTLKAGALKRYAAKNGELLAYVGKGTQCHENGNPLICTEYKLKLST